MISVIVPVYNSEKTLERLCYQIINTMKELKNDYEIILVNDKSNDNSYNIIKKLSKDIHIISIHLERNVGQQNALLCGLRRCKGDYAITIDDDLQYSPKDIPKLLEKIYLGYDIVYGVPIKKAHSNLRNLGTKIKDLLFNISIKKPKGISITSFRVMNRKLIDKIILDNNSFVYLSASTFKHTKKAANIFVPHSKRLYGASNYSYLKLIKLFFNIIIYYSDIRVFKLFKKDIPQYKIMEVIK